MLCGRVLCKAFSGFGLGLVRWVWGVDQSMYAGYPGRAPALDQARGRPMDPSQEMYAGRNETSALGTYAVLFAGLMLAA